MDVKITRRIPASIETVYRAWTDPAQIAKWQGGKLIAEIAVDGLWFWGHKSDSGKEVPHYGRYLTLEKNARVVTTWVSPFTKGQESRLEISMCEGPDSSVACRSDRWRDLFEAWLKTSS